MLPTKEILREEVIVDINKPVEPLIIEKKETANTYEQIETEYKNGNYIGRTTTIEPKKNPAVPSILTKAWNKEYKPTDIYDSFWLLCRKSGYKGTYQDFIKTKEKYEYFKDRMFLSNINDRIVYNLIAKMPVGQRVIILPRKRCRQAQLINHPIEFLSCCIASLENIVANTNINDALITRLVEIVDEKIIGRLFALKERINDNLCLQVIETYENALIDDKK